MTTSSGFIEWLDVRSCTLLHRVSAYERKSRSDTLIKPRAADKSKTHQRLAMKSIKFPYSSHECVWTRTAPTPMIYSTHHYLKTIFPRSFNHWDPHSYVAHSSYVHAGNLIDFLLLFRQQRIKCSWFIPLSHPRLWRYWTRFGSLGMTGAPRGVMVAYHQHTSLDTGCGFLAGPFLSRQEVSWAKARRKFY